MNTAASQSETDQTQPGDNDSAPQPGNDPKQSISATERWRLISNKAYSRAQKRGFVGGDPIEDLSEAIRQIDAEYDTDVNAILVLTDTAQMTAQFRDLFAGYGLGQRSLDRLLEINRDALEKLAAANSALVNGVAERSAKRASLLRDVTDEAVHTLQSMARSTRQIDDLAHLPGQPMQALLNITAHLRALANSAGESALASESARDQSLSPAQQGLEIHGAVNKSYEGKTAAELAEAPIGALKGVSSTHSQQLALAFGMASIRDMANSYLVEQAEGIVILAEEEVPDPAGGGSADSEGSLRELADAPVVRLKGVTSLQAEVLHQAFRISTVRDLAGNRFFRLARAIVTLADLES